MYEAFPNKSRGDRLEAAHVNRLSAVCRRLAGNSGGYGSSISASFAGSSNLPPFVQAIVRVQSDEGGGVYKARIRYYEADTNSWATSTEEYTLDASDTGGAYAEGDKVVAFYHEQSGFFIPIGTSIGTVLRVGKASGSIGVGAEDGVVNLYEQGEATGSTQSQVHHDWVTGGVAVPDGAEVILGYFADEQVWRIIGANCS